ncbi:glycosyltransferase family 9 protein [Parasphingorhabdus pacifica]
MNGTILVLRALGLGDVLTAVPALRALRQAWPRHRLVLAAPRSLAELVPLTRAADDLWPTDGPMALSWSAPAPGIAVNLHGKGPQSLEAVRSTGAECVLSHRHPAHPDVDGPDWSDDQHEVSRWCRMLRWYGLEPDDADLFLAPPEESFRPGSTVVHPGASHGARRWPVERFAAVAGKLAARGERVVITGSAAERPAAERVAELAGIEDSAVLAGSTSLRQLTALVHGARLVLCGDTGLAHVATAYHRPSVTLFGPVSPFHWGPPKDRRHVTLWNGTTGDTFADRPDPALLELSTAAVLESAETLLDRGDSEVAR